MSVVTGDVVVDEFTTSNPTTGAAADADSTPTGTLYVDGTASGNSVTVTAQAGDGEYKFSVTMPTLTTGQRVSVRIVATVAGVTGTAVVWRDWAEVRQTGDAYARLGANGAGLTALGDTRLANLDAAVSSRSSHSAADVITAWLANSTIATMITRIDAAITSRLASGSYTAPDNASAAAAAASAATAATQATTAATQTTAGNIRSAIGLAAANLDDQLAAVSAPTVEEIDGQLSGTHGSGPWGAGVQGSVEYPYPVLDPDDNPVPDAFVWVTAEGSSLVLDAKYTDETGVALFRLDPGFYDFYTRKGGYVSTGPDTEEVVA